MLINKTEVLPIFLLGGNLKCNYFCLLFRPSCHHWANEYRQTQDSGDVWKRWCWKEYILNPALICPCWDGQWVFFFDNMDCEVGLLDIDICGPSIAMLGLEGQCIHQSNFSWQPVCWVKPWCYVNWLPSSQPNWCCCLEGSLQEWSHQTIPKGCDWGNIDYLVMDTWYPTRDVGRKHLDCAIPQERRNWWSNHRHHSAASFSNWCEEGDKFLQDSWVSSPGSWVSLKTWVAWGRQFWIWDLWSQVSQGDRRHRVGS